MLPNVSARGKDGAAEVEGAPMIWLVTLPLLAFLVFPGWKR